MSSSISRPQTRVLWLIAFTLALVSCGDSPQSWDAVAASAPGKFLVTQLPPGAKLTHNYDCNIESFNGSPISEDIVTVKRGSEISTAGWAADAGTKKAVENLYVVIVHPEGAVMYVAKSGNRVNRQDIGNYNPTGLGFQSRGDTSVISPGSYHLVVLSEQQKVFKMCDRGRKVQVAP
jgi:hypothetical protein